MSGTRQSLQHVIVTTAAAVIVVIFITDPWPRTAPGKFSVITLSTCLSLIGTHTCLEAAGSGEVGD